MKRRNSTTPSSSRGGRRDNNNKKVVIAVIAAIVVLIVIFSVKSCPTKHNLPLKSQTVREIKPNGDLTLSNGLTVQLLGISPNEQTVEFLNRNIKGATVDVIPDSHDTQAYYTNPEKSVVRAYVNVLSSTKIPNLNGYMLKNHLAELSSAFCQDSLAAFQSYIKAKKSNDSSADNNEDGRMYTKTELSKKMLPATFLILAADGDGGGALGTGFFINENGLALTNYHVFEAAQMAKAFLCDENGNITQEQNRNISRVIAYNQQYDWCIFVVDLDPGEKSKYLSLSKKNVERGQDIAVVGNPLGYTATFTTGEITNVHPEAKTIQFDASINHGNSGGPVCTFDGKVVGIVKSLAADSEGKEATGNINFGVDIQEVRKALDKLNDVKTYGGK